MPPQTTLERDRKVQRVIRRLAPTPVDDYALKVKSGHIPAGKYHRLACLRHLKDRERETDPTFPFRFDWGMAWRFIDFAQNMRHYKGRQFAGRQITLSDSQVFRLGSIFGWRYKSNQLRRFTTAYNELPRKSGKTLEAAIVALYVTFFEHEPGAEGYCIATKKDQAKLVFDAAKKLVRASGLRSRIAMLVNNMNRSEYDQKLEPLGADADSTDGLNPYLIVTDEFHAHKNRKLVDVMESATGARVTFLHFIITTAGDDPVSPCGDEHDYATRILDGVLPDDEATLSYFAFIAHADPTDDWKLEATWQKANPHWGISVNPDDLRKVAKAALHVPQKAAEFQQKRLNLWVNRSQPSLSVDGWRAGQTNFAVDEMLHQQCWAGFDIGMKLDLCSLSLLFPPAGARKRFRLLQYLWTPLDTLVERTHRDRAPYDIWHSQGWLMAPHGVSVPPMVVRAKLNELRPQFDIECVGFDPWHADQLAFDLVATDGWQKEQIIEVPQTFTHLTSAEQKFKAETLAGNIDARNCPVTAWAVSNVIDQTDEKGNILFSKKRSRGRIDPVKSATIAMSVYLRQPITPAPQYQVMVFGGGGGTGRRI